MESPPRVELCHQDTYSQCSARAFSIMEPISLLVTVASLHKYHPVMKSASPNESVHPFQTKPTQALKTQIECMGSFIQNVTQRPSSNSR